MIVYKPEWKEKIKGSIKPAVVFGGAILAGALLWHVAVDAPDGKLHITLLDGRNAGTVFIQSPTGRYVLVNGGEDRNALLSAVGRRLPIHFRRLDALILSPGSSSDLLALTAALPQLDVESILQVGALPSSRGAATLTETIGSLGRTIQTVAIGDRLDLGDGASLTIIRADEEQKILKVEWQDFSFLLGFGEVDASTLPPAAVVYLADGEEVQFERFAPQLLVVDGAVSGEGVSTISTLQHGWITLTTDGQSDVGRGGEVA